MGVAPDAVTGVLAAKPSWHLADAVEELDGVAGKAHAIGPAPPGVGKIELLAAARPEGVRGISHHPLLDEPVFALLGNLRAICKSPSCTRQRR